MTASQTRLEELRKIPSVNDVLLMLQEEEWASAYPKNLITSTVREVLELLRHQVLNSGGDVPHHKAILEQVRLRLDAGSTFSLSSVINATGIIVHTNLGRAPLAAEAMRHISEIAEGYSNLEFDLEEGARGSREKHVAGILGRLLPAEESLVVNNNAAALMLILNTFAEGKEVIVSRGELVEIGGSFRLPDIMKKSQATLREVGTTNRTRLEDYRDAINEKTGLILLVHPSNYQIIGFTEHPDAADLVALGGSRGIPVVEDHGSGILTDVSRFGIPDEPHVSARLEIGFDAVCFSGDKILGGPQAGIVCGKREAVNRMRKNPLFRALRVDKMVYAALEATLRLYLLGRLDAIPVLKMLMATPEELQTAAEVWRKELQSAFPDASFSVEATTCYAGGGVAPMKGLESRAVSLRHPAMKAQSIAAALRNGNPPVVARIGEDRVYFELRTLDEEARAAITKALQKILPC